MQISKFNGATSTSPCPAIRKKRLCKQQTQISSKYDMAVIICLINSNYRFIYGNRLISDCRFLRIYLWWNPSSQPHHLLFSISSEQYRGAGVPSCKNEWRQKSTPFKLILIDNDSWEPAPRPGQQPEMANMCMRCVAANPMCMNYFIYIMAECNKNFKIV